MPQIEVIFFKESDGTVPMADWLRSLPLKPRTKCLAWIGRLRMFGHELRRPSADYLRDGIYELRVGLQGANYRVLYFFHGNQAVVLSHGLAKEQVVPPLDIDRAVVRKRHFEKDPAGHMHVWEQSSWEIRR